LGSHGFFIRQIKFAMRTLFHQFNSKFCGTALKAFEESGIGERTIEGFGRIAINWNTSEEIKKVTASIIVDDTSQSKTLTSISDQAKRIVERLWRSQLESELTKKINDIDLSKTSIPERAQLSRLRQVVLNALAENNPALVTTFLQNLKANARQKYERCRIGEKRLTAWVETAVGDFESKLDSKFKTPTTIGGVTLEPEQQTRIRTEFGLHYLAGVVHRMYKTKSQETGDSHDNN
jgi:CRISPR-associated protein Csx10